MTKLKRITELVNDSHSVLLRLQFRTVWGKVYNRDIIRKGASSTWFYVDTQDQVDWSLKGVIEAFLGMSVTEYDVNISSRSTLTTDRVNRLRIEHKASKLIKNSKD